MRRFYVRPAFRRSGVGRESVLALLAVARWKQQRAGAARLRRDHRAHQRRRENIVVGRGLGDRLRQVDTLSVDTANFNRGRRSGCGGRATAGQFAASHRGQ
jgi:hypothetical protein